MKRFMESGALCVILSVLVFSASFAEADTSNADSGSPSSITPGRSVPSTPSPCTSDDSTCVHQVPVTVQGGKGSVLSSGSYTLFCGSAGTWDPYSSSSINCTYTVSTTQCPAGLKPTASISLINNDYGTGCEFKGYNIDSTPVPQDNGQGGYALQFNNAYADFNDCDNREVTISYTISCL